MQTREAEIRQVRWREAEATEPGEDRDRDHYFGTPEGEWIGDALMLRQPGVPQQTATRMLGQLTAHRPTSRDLLVRAVLGDEPGVHRVNVAMLQDMELEPLNRHLSPSTRSARATRCATSRSRTRLCSSAVAVAAAACGRLVALGSR